MAYHPLDQLLGQIGGGDVVGAVRDRQSDAFDSFAAGPGGIGRGFVRPDRVAVWLGVLAHWRIWPAMPVLTTTRPARLAIYCEGGLAIYCEGELAIYCPRDLAIYSPGGLAVYSYPRVPHSFQ